MSQGQGVFTPHHLIEYIFCAI